MPFTKIQFRPGVNRENTSYANEGGWYDCNMVRFTKGFPEKIGGWTRYSNFSYLGTVRSMLPWADLSGAKLLGVGTNIKFYVENGGVFNDITPIRESSAVGGATFSATSGSATITVSDANHGANVGDFVTFTDAASLGGNITADVLNQEYEVISVIDASTYTIEARVANTTISDITIDGALVPTPVAADGSDTGNGGSSTVASYQINIGLNVAVFGTGWGAGAWSRGTWGSAASTTVLTGNLRTWSQDTFGEDLIINAHNGGIYYWDRSLSSGAFQRAVALSDLSGANGAPTVARRIIVSDRDRHVIAFGCDPINDVGTIDPLLIRFSSQENPADWTPVAGNTAGDFRIGSGSEIITAIETRQQIIVFTDASLYAMQYLGPPFTFGVNMISENTTIQGPNAAVAIDDTVFWMGRGEFYMYNGAVQRLPCSVRSYVFDDFNYSQGDQVFASSNTQHSEVWWFYPSEASTSNDRYVIYNYMENVWYFGSLTRSAWTDRGSIASPVAAAEDGYLYSHDIGFDDGSVNPPVAVSAYLESSPIDIDDGDKFSSIRRVLPDIDFGQSTNSSPFVDITVSTRNVTNGPYVSSASGSYQGVDPKPVDLRARGRQMTFKIQSDDTGVTWRLGMPRFDMRPDGRR